MAVYVVASCSPSRRSAASLHPTVVLPAFCDRLTGMRDLLALRMRERRNEILAVLLDGAIEDRDRKTLLALFDQAFGRPQERVEVTEQGGVDLTQLSLEELSAMRDRVLAENPQLRLALVTQSCPKRSARAQWLSHSQRRRHSLKMTLTRLDEADQSVRVAAWPCPSPSGRRRCRVLSCSGGCASATNAAPTSTKPSSRSPAA
jgi:hypothetical protein